MIRWRSANARSQEQLEVCACLDDYLNGHFLMPTDVHDKRKDTLDAHAGNAPTLMSLKHLKQVAPTWMNTSKAIFDDKEAHEVLQSLHIQVSMCQAHECPQPGEKAFRSKACLQQDAAYNIACLGARCIEI